VLKKLREENCSKKRLASPQRIGIILDEPLAEAIITLHITPVL
jgi:hypothetical protein